MMEQGLYIDKPLNFDIALMQLSFHTVCSHSISAQSNCAEGLHFGTFILKSQIRT